MREIDTFLVLYFSPSGSPIGDRPQRIVNYAKPYTFVYIKSTGESDLVIRLTYINKLTSTWLLGNG